jgi:hypothetical protein
VDKNADGRIAEEEIKEVFLSLCAPSINYLVLLPLISLSVNLMGNSIRVLSFFIPKTTAMSANDVMNFLFCVNSWR